MRRLWPGLCLALLVGAAGLQAAPSPLALTPGSGTAWQTYQAALREWQGGRVTAAERLFIQAAALAPEWVAPRGHLGAICQMRGDREQALAHYTRVQEISQEGLPTDQLTRPEAQLRLQIIEAEVAMIWHVNEARSQARVRLLAPETELGKVARRHSEEMRDRGYFNHQSPVPGRRSTQDRFFALFNYRPRLIGENLSRRWGSYFCLNLDNIKRSHEELMASPGHRANIEMAAFEWIGLGVAADASGAYWLTEVFVQTGR